MELILKMEFLKIIDILNLVIIIAVLVIVILKARHSQKKAFSLYIPGILSLSFVLFLEVNHTLTIYKYLFGFVALTYTLVSSAYITQIDRGKKFSAYYSFGSIFLGLFTIFTIHFGGIVNSVLTMPLFYTLMIISLSIIIIVPIIALVTNRVNTYVLLEVIGWVIVAFAIWSQGSMYTGIIFSKILLFIGIICLAGNFYLKDWNSR